MHEHSGREKSVNVAAPGNLAVMYHYVRPRESRIPGGIRPLFVDEFEAQLDWLSSQYDITPADAFLERLRQPRGNRPACLLTFDDGTRDHAEVVAPILQRRGLSGVFFILTWPCELGKMPLTHAVHWLLGEDEASVWARFESFARAKLGGTDSLGDPREAERIYHYESPLRARVKYAANMALPAQATECVVRASMADAGIAMSDLAAEWFLSREQIRHLHAIGMTIGVHGCSHSSLQTLGARGIRDEIQHASLYLTNLIGQRPSWFSCPFGGTGGDADAICAMKDAMREAGLMAAMTTEKRPARSGCDPLSIPRFDAIDLPPRAKLPRGLSHCP